MRIASAIFALIFAWGPCAWAQDEFEDDLRPGLMIDMITPLGNATRWAREIDGSVSQHDAATSITWRGLLLIRNDDAHQFHAYVAGKIRVQMGEDVVLDTTRETAGWVSGKSQAFPLGEQPFVVQYEPTDPAQPLLKLYWSADSFPLEPVPHHVLFHEDDSAPQRLAITGLQQMTAANCTGCHATAITVAPLSRYSLKHIANGRSWSAMRERLMRVDADPEHGRMPAYGLSADDADAVLAYLAKETTPLELPEPAKFKIDAKTTPTGRELIKSVGCLACHEWQGLGRLTPFGGAKLDAIASRRTRNWLDQWLQQPANINPGHRMPVFNLSGAERQQIIQALIGEQTFPKENPPPKVTDELVARGREVIIANRCAVCHEFPGEFPAVTPTLPALTVKNVQMQAGCLSDSPDPSKSRPMFSHVDAHAIAAALTPELKPRSLTMLDRSGCVNCHDRDGQRGLSQITLSVLKTEPQWEGQTPTLSPPPLTAVGDRMRDDALAKAVRGELPVRLNWLKVRMPKFREDQVHEIPALVIAKDRIPDEAPATPSYPIATDKTDPQVMIAGRELTGGKGFSCVACHQLKDYVPPKVALGTRGSDLYQLGERMRAPYFFRWTRSPLRILPGVEMPSYQRPHPTLLKGDLNRQLAAIWDALHDPQFTAPTNPAVVEQLWGTSESGRARVLRDVFTLTDSDGKTVTLPKTFAAGFSNRHNVLFDLEHGCVRTWTIGDFARQRTQGKSWFWELAGSAIADFPLTTDVYLFDERTREVISPETGWKPHVQFVSSKIEADGSVRWQYTLAWSREGGPLERSTHLYERWRLGSSRRWERGIDSDEAPLGHSVWFRKPQLLHPLGNPLIKPDSKWSRPIESAPEGRLVAEPSKVGSPWWISYESDVYPPLIKTQPPVTETIVPQEVTALPGYNGVRLPVTRSIMPTAMTWDAKHELFFTSLKGQVFRAHDSDEDGIEDQLEVYTEGLAAPFGVLATERGLLVAHKPEVLRITGPGLNREMVTGQAQISEVVATGWGYTEDYHDWTCGIVRDSQGRYYIGLGSDYTHKNRLPADSRWRGQILRFDGRGQVEPIATGLRYPTGLAMLPGDRLIVSDQQGVQNCFNELNWIQVGHRYGVPAKLDPRDDTPADSPAVQIPHPWTRSVNGLAVWPMMIELPTPATGDNSVRSPDQPPPKVSSRHPFAGHVVGAEYNGRFLIRASFEMVGDQLQGAVYPLSRPGTTNGPEELLGPMCVAFTPTGTVYVGSLHDSGWLGGLNTGDIVRFTPDGPLPNGIREVRAVPEGFEIDFVRPVDVDKAWDHSNYQISGYTRVWGGDYATPDSGRHTAEVKKVRTKNNFSTVTLWVEGLKPGHVYDLNVGNLGSEKTWWPGIAHYTLKNLPE
ncbi:hypothetical protein GC163_11735 [bacterium]|nr:hypothetical protein [bacterium]